MLVLPKILLVCLALVPTLLAAPTQSPTMKAPVKEDRILKGLIRQQARIFSRLLEVLNNYLLKMLKNGSPTTTFHLQNGQCNPECIKLFMELIASINASKRPLKHLLRLTQSRHTKGGLYLPYFVPVPANSE